MVKVEWDGKKREMGFEGSVSALLKELGVQREMVVVKVNGKLAPDGKRVGEGDKVEVIRVVYGG